MSANVYLTCDCSCDCNRRARLAFAAHSDTPMPRRIATALRAARHQGWFAGLDFTAYCPTCRDHTRMEVPNGR